MSQITTWDEFPIVDYIPGVERQAVSGEKVMLTRIRYRPASSCRSTATRRSS